MAWLNAGQAIENIGTRLGLPEYGLSEKVAGRNTLLTGQTTQSQKVYQPAGTNPSTPNTYKLPASKGVVLGTSTQQSGGGNGGSNGVLSDPYGGAAEATQSEGDANLQQLLTEYDRNAEELRAQLGEAGINRKLGLDSLQSAVDAYGNVIGKQKTDVTNSSAKQIQSAGSTAAQTQAKSRNVLRALGILSSSAAGDILSRPMTEFGTQKADIQMATQQRIQQLDDALAQKTSEHAGLVKQLESQYASLVDGIQRDLRFSDRERADAVASAKAAVLSRLSEIRTAQADWQNQIATAKNGLSAMTTSLSNFTNPTANTGAIASTGLDTTQQYNPNSKQVSMVDPKKKLNDQTIYGQDSDRLSSIYV